MHVCVCFRIIPYINSFGRTMLYVCIEYCIQVNMYHVSAQGIDERRIHAHYYYYCHCQTNRLCVFCCALPYILPPPNPPPPPPIFREISSLHTDSLLLNDADSFLLLHRCSVHAGLLRTCHLIHHFPWFIHDFPQPVHHFTNCYMVFLCVSV